MAKSEIILPTDLSELRYVDATKHVDQTSAIQTKKARMWDKVKKNPFVPIGVLTTTGILGAGFRYWFKRDSVKQQQMMRGRITAQFSTFFVIVLGSIYQGTFNRKANEPENSVDYSKFDKI